jgi:hypothetical protein
MQHPDEPVVLWAPAHELEGPVPALQAAEQAMEARRALLRLVDRDTRRSSVTGPCTVAPGRVPPRQRLQRLLST